jgi:hypothetical protein
MYVISHQRHVADCLSFFGTQEGDFSLSIISLSAVTKAFNATSSTYAEQYGEDRSDIKDYPNGQDSLSTSTSKQEVRNPSVDASRTQQGWFEWLFGRCSGKTSTET